MPAVVRVLFPAVLIGACLFGVIFYGGMDVDRRVFIESELIPLEEANTLGESNILTEAIELNDTAAPEIIVTLGEASTLETSHDDCWFTLALEHRLIDGPPPCNISAMFDDLYEAQDECCNCSECTGIVQEGWQTDTIHQYYLRAGLQIEYDPSGTVLYAKMDLPSEILPFNQVPFINTSENGMVSELGFHEYETRLYRDDFMRINTRQLKDTMDRLGYDWWATEGLLLSILRFGNLFGIFDRKTCNTPDRDLDIMVRVDNKTHWDTVVRPQIYEEFENTLGGRCKDGYGLTQCHWHWDGTNISKDEFAWGAWHGKKITDIHWYTKNDTDNTLYVSQLRSLGDAIDASVIYPLSRCKVYDFTLPCPHDSIMLLTHWASPMKGGTEYATGCNPCQMIYPDKPMQSCEMGSQIHRFTDRKKKPTRWDKVNIESTYFQRLANYSKRLDDLGFNSFHPIFEGWPGICAEQNLCSKWEVTYKT